MIHRASDIKKVKVFCTAEELIDAVKREAEGPVFVSELDRFGLFDPYIGVLFETPQRIHMDDSKKESLLESINRTLWDKMVWSGKA